MQNYLFFLSIFRKISSTQEKKIKSTLAGRDTKKKSYTKIFSKISYSSNKFILSASKVRPPFFSSDPSGTMDPL